MWNLPNLFSLTRGALAFFLFSSNPYVRLFAVLSAAFTDFLDGFLARRNHSETAIGAVLDPLMDKFFVITALSIFFLENKLEPVMLMKLLCRDFSVVLFGCYLVFRKRLFQYKFRSIWTGKCFTFLQFFVLLSLCMGIPLPKEFYNLFLILGFLALCELYSTRHRALVLE